jgi:hypothetical protein
MQMIQTLPAGSASTEGSAVGPRRIHRRHSGNPCPIFVYDIGEGAGRHCWPRRHSSGPGAKGRQGLPQLGEARQHRVGGAVGGEADARVQRVEGILGRQLQKGDMTGGMD